MTKLIIAMIAMASSLYGNPKDKSSIVQNTDCWEDFGNGPTKAKTPQPKDVSNSDVYIKGGIERNAESTSLPNEPSE